MEGPEVIGAEHFGGAAEVLGDDALSVNPFDVSATAEAVNDALTMPLDERAARAERMRAAATRLPPVFSVVAT